MTKVPKFVIPDRCNGNEIHELANWVARHFLHGSLGKTDEIVAVNRGVIIEAVHTVFDSLIPRYSNNRRPEIVSKYGAGPLLEAVDNQNWDALPQALSYFVIGVTYS